MKTKKRIVTAIFSAILIAVSTVSVAQEKEIDKKNQTGKDNNKESKQAGKENKVTEHDAVWLKDGYVVEGEKVLVISNGKVTQLTREITFKNGNKLTTNAVLIKNGEQTNLKDGDFLDMDGQVKNREGMTKNCMMMKDGKMIISKNGKMSPMNKDVTTKNGTVCSMDGICTTKEGKKITLKDGDCLDMDGQILNRNGQIMSK